MTSYMTIKHRENQSPRPVHRNGLASGAVVDIPLYWPLRAHAVRTRKRLRIPNISVRSGPPKLVFAEHGYAQEIGTPNWRMKNVCPVKVLRTCEITIRPLDFSKLREYMNKSSVHVQKASAWQNTTEAFTNQNYSRQICSNKMRYEQLWTKTNSTRIQNL